MIDLNKLHIFDIVAQTGNFSTAAERLLMTQSAVSQHIKDLEASLGQQLFIRGRRGVSLTSEGELLAEYSRSIFDLVMEAENALTNVERLPSGKVSVGATPGVGIYLMPDWVQKFRAQFPQLTVVLHTGITGQITADILAHRIDIGIVEGEIDTHHSSRLSYQLLEEVEQMVVVGFQHPLWEREQVTLADLDGQSFIVRQQGSQSRAWLEEILQKHHINPIIGAEFDNLESMKRAVTAGRCLAILPRYIVEAEVEQHQLHAMPISGSPLVRSIKLVWDSKTPFSPVTLAFLNDLSERYPDLKAILHARQNAAHHKRTTP